MDRPGALPKLPQWGALAEAPYDEVLADVLAMWAKGFVACVDEDQERLAPSAKGREALRSAQG